jgi:cytoskeletal protein RodZ
MVLLEQMKDMRRKPGKPVSLLSRLSVSRQEQGLSLEQIADRSKISLFFLKAIEAGEFDKLPGGLYDVCYLRQYAAQIGFPEAELISFYRSCSCSDVEPAPSHRASRKGRLAALVAGWLGVRG